MYLPLLSLYLPLFINIFTPVIIFIPGRHSIYPCSLLYLPLVGIISTPGNLCIYPWWSYSSLVLYILCILWLAHHFQLVQLSLFNIMSIRFFPLLNNAHHFNQRPNWVFSCEPPSLLSVFYYNFNIFLQHNYLFLSKHLASRGWRYGGGLPCSIAMEPEIVFAFVFVFVLVFLQIHHFNQRLGVLLQPFGGVYFQCRINQTLPAVFGAWASRWPPSTRCQGKN